MVQVLSRELQVTTRSFFVSTEQDSKTIKQVEQLKKIRHKNVGWIFFKKQLKLEINVKLPEVGVLGMITSSFFVTCDQVSKEVKPVQWLKKVR